ncbi:hypothetical protein [Mesorhizobium sp. B2-3-13]|nr:hypothetical protein [Mesorhizobium sp. B2-3-13]
MAQKKRAKLASVALINGTPAALLLRDLVQQPEGWRVFAPAGSDPGAVR